MKSIDSYWCKQNQVQCTCTAFDLCVSLWTQAHRMPLKRQETWAPRSHTRCRHSEQQDRHQGLQLGSEGEARGETKTSVSPSRWKAMDVPEGLRTLVKGLEHVTLKGYIQKKINYLSVYLSIYISGSTIFLIEKQTQWSTGPVALQQTQWACTPFLTDRIKTLEDWRPPKPDTSVSGNHLNEGFQAMVHLS